MFKSVMLLLAVCMIFAPLSPVWGASDGAMKLRALNGLGDFTPPETFLNGNFIADEITPNTFSERSKTSGSPGPARRPGSSKTARGIV